MFLLPTLLSFRAILTLPDQPTLKPSSLLSTRTIVTSAIMTATSTPAGAGSSSSSSSTSYHRKTSPHPLLDRTPLGNVVRYDELHLSPQDESTIKLVADYLQLPLEELGGEKAKKSERRAVGSGEGRSCAWVGKCELIRWRREERWVRVSVGFKLRRGKKEEEMTRMWTSAKDAPDWLGRDRVEEVNRILAHTTNGSRGGERGRRGEDAVGQILSKIESVSEFLLTLPPLLPLSTTRMLPLQPHRTPLHPNQQKSHHRRNQRHKTSIEHGSTSPLSAPNPTNRHLSTRPHIHPTHSPGFS